MNNTFNSNIYDFVKWIPVLTLEGNKELVTLRDLFLKSHLFEDYCLDSVPEKSSLQHFINFIGKAFFRKNKNYKFTTELKLMEDIVQYLDLYKDHFQLAGRDFYFLQRPFFNKLSEKDSITPISKLLPEIESGNNGCFFTKASDDDSPNMPVHLTIFALLQGHLLNYGGTGGGFKNEKTNFTDTVTARSISVFVKESNLASSIYKNIYLYYLYNIKFNTDYVTNIPAIWECSDHGDSTFQNLKNLSGCEAFQKFGYERMFKIDWWIDPVSNEPFAKSVKMAQGIEKADDIELFYPALITAKDKKDELNIYIKARKEKSIWRDLDCIVQKYSPIFLDNKKLLGQFFNIEILALYTDKAKIEGSIRSNFSLPSNLLDPDKVNTLTKYLKDIENQAFHLKNNFKNAIEFSIRDGDKTGDDKQKENILKHSNALEEYWNHIGLYFVKNATLKKIAEEDDDLNIKKDLNKNIYFSKEKAIQKFIQDFPDKKTKFKLIGYLYKDFENDRK